MQLEEVNVIPSGKIAVVSKFGIVTSDTGNPERMVLNIALNPDKAKNYVEASIFIPALGNYHSYQHVQMLNSFQRGEPFVAVDLYDVTIYEKEDGYYGWARGFDIADLEELEDVLPWL